jgi:predicted permease
MGTVWHDTRYGLRVLLRSPAFTGLAVLIFALGIGANTAIFSVINAVLLRPLPIADPARVVIVHDQLPKLNLMRTQVSSPQYLDYSQRTNIFEASAATTGSPVNLTGVDVPERLRLERVTASFFPMLGIEPIVGRVFSSQEDEYGAPHAAILSCHVWKRLFNGDPEAIGKTLMLDGNGYEVIGILPGKVEELYPRVDIWSPMAFAPNELAENRRWSLGTNMLARLAPGVSLQHAQAVMSDAATSMRDGSSDFNIEVRPLLDERVGEVRKPLYVLLGAVAVVLLISCANVASLLLARGSARTREIAVRAALGAARSRIIRQLLTESLLLAIAGGALGVLLGLFSIDALARLAPASIPRAGQIRLDQSVLWLTGGASIICGVLFGLIPAIAASKTDLIRPLNESGRSGADSPSRHRLRSGLVVAEVALAFGLLVTAGLLLRSFARLLDVKPGFDPHNVLTMQVALPRNQYQKAKIGNFYDEAVDRIRALPGVLHAAAAFAPPFIGGDNSVFAIRDREAGPGAPPPHADYLDVTPDYFDSLRIPLFEGRTFYQSDMPDLEKGGASIDGSAVIVDQTLAKKYWPNSDPVGRNLGWSDNGPWATIVGIVGTAKPRDLAEEAEGTIYFPSYFPNSTLVIRTAGDPRGLVQPIRDQVHAIDPNLPLYDIQTMDDRIAHTLDDRRFVVMLLSVFAALALLLAASGLYGVISYLATQRTHEIGIRMALGARRADVVGLVIRHALVLAGIGLPLGAALSLLFSQYLTSLFYGVTATDPLTLAAVSLLLAAVATAAALIPAWRAARVDPMVALRYQ